MAAPAPPPSLAVVLTKAQEGDSKHGWLAAQLGPRRSSEPAALARDLLALYRRVLVVPKARAPPRPLPGGR